MRLIGMWTALGLAVLLGAASAAPAERTALLQSKTIFRSGLRNTHTVALTFDDGPNANTGAVLDALKAEHVKATFFIVGKMSERHPDILARIAAEGHLLANHSATHAYLGRRYDTHPQLLIDQLEGVQAQIAPLMKPSDKLYFRAPLAPGGRPMRRSSMPIRCCVIMSARSIGMSAAISPRMMTAM